MTTRDLSPEYQAPFYPAVQYLESALEPEIAEYAFLRASALNGCRVCTATHRRNSRGLGFPEAKITAIEHWTEHRAEFEDKEIALLEFTDAVTTLEGREAAVPDELWARMEDHYGKEGTRNLLVAIITINVFNRFGIAAQMDPAKVEGASEFDLTQ